MRQKTFISFSLALIATLLSAIIFSAPREVRAVVPTWDTGLNGPAPTMGITDSSGWFIRKEIGQNFGGYTSVSGAIDSVISSASDLAKSATAWDSIAKAAANTFLDLAKTSMIEWIKSGFDGEPSFVQDPEQFFGDVGNIASASFIESIRQGTGIDLCNPDLGLKLFYPRKRGNPFRLRADCTIADAQNALSRFSEDFSDGGWRRWIQVSETNNNAMGVYLTLLGEENMRRADAQAMMAQQLAWGNGILPSVASGECAEYGDGPPDASGNYPCLRYVNKTLTPGTFIGDRVGTFLGSDIAGFNAADEVSEVVTALINMGIQKGIGSILEMKSER